MTDLDPRVAATMNVDGANNAMVLAAVLGCALGWEADARIIGNVRAGDIVRALQALSASPSPPALDGAGRDGWQPIETAPRDGTPIIAWDGFGYGVVCWDPDLAGTEAPSQWALCNRFATDALVPTHWQPLPAPPKETP